MMEDTFLFIWVFQKTKEIFHKNVHEVSKFPVNFQSVLLIKEEITSVIFTNRRSQLKRYHTRKPSPV